MTPTSLVQRLRRYRDRRWPRYVFIHINKTAGSSIEKALDLPFEHKTALQKREELGPSRWRSAFKFSFVRNPWDKVVSHYHYRVKTNQTGMGDGHIDFRDWVLRAYGDHDPRYWDQPMMFMPQVEWIADANGSLLVDFVGRFEQLDRDFQVVSERIGCGSSLPQTKASRHDRYTAYYDADTRGVVESRFQKDIEAFGYRFDS